MGRKPNETWSQAHIAKEEIKRIYWEMGEMENNNFTFLQYLPEATGTWK